MGSTLFNFKGLFRRTRTREIQYVGWINNRHLRDMKQTAVEWLQEALEQTILTHEQEMQTIGLFEQAKAMEKDITDNKVIHFAEWLTNKHTTTLISLYEHFEEQYYNETFKSE